MLIQIQTPLIKKRKWAIINKLIKIMSNEKKTTLEAMLAQYESATTETKAKTTFDLKNYFTTYLPDGINTAIKRVRILPVSDGTPFIAVHVHSIQVEGKNRKFTCLAHESDLPCPFCEAREELLSTGEESDKELAKNYRPRLMYIVKVIDRENEADGPKFWRFPSNFKKACTTFGRGVGSKKNNCRILLSICMVH